MYFDVKTLTSSGFFYGLEIVVFNDVGSHTSKVVPTVFVVLIQQHIGGIVHFAGQCLGSGFMRITAVIAAVLTLNEHAFFGREVNKFTVAV